MWKFNYQFDKKYGYWHCSLPFNETNIRSIKLMLCCDIADLYLKNKNDKLAFQKFILSQDVENYYSFLEKVDRFATDNKIQFKINEHTEDYSPIRKLTAKIFQYVLIRFARHINAQCRVSLSNGVQHDITYNGKKIDAKTKNGVSKFFNKDYQLTTAYNTLNNNNDSDYYCFGICAKKYWQQDNIINYVIAGIIDKNDFYSKARMRKKDELLTNRNGQPTLKNGQKMYAKQADYVVYAEILNSIEDFFKK